MCPRRLAEEKVSHVRLLRNPCEYGRAIPAAEFPPDYSCTGVRERRIGEEAVEDYHSSSHGRPERRSLPRLAPASRIWAALENMTRNEMLGMTEVADFSGLGIALRGIAGRPEAAVGDALSVTLIAEQGLIPLRGTLVHIGRHGLLGLQVKAPAAPGQHFLLRLYQRASSPTTAPPPPAP